MGSVRLFDDPGEERRMQERLAAMRAQAQTFAATVTDADAARLVALRKAYPQIPARALLAVARGGGQPGEPGVEQLSQAAVKKKSRGIGWHSIGDVVKVGARGVARGADFVTPEAVEDAIGSAGGVATTAVRGAARGVITAAMAPIEEGVGLVRNIGAEFGGAAAGAAGGAGFGAAVGSIVPGVGTAIGAGVGAAAGALLGKDVEIEGDAQWLRSQSNLGIAVEQLRDTGRIDQGRGYLPGGSVWEAQAERARAAAMVGDHALTPGRLLAYNVFEPDSKPYALMSGLIDAGIAVKIDPGQLALKRLGTQRRMSKEFLSGDAGLIRGARLAFDPDKAAGWVAREGELWDYIAKEKDWYRLWKNTKGKLDIDTMNRVIDADTPEQVLNVIRPKLGIEIGEKFGVKAGVREAGDRPFTERGFEMVVRRDPNETRILQEFPAAHLDPSDPTQAVTASIDYLRNAKVPDAQIGPVIERIARAKDAPDAFAASVDGLFGVVETHLATLIPGPRARKLTQAWRSAYDDSRGYFRDTISGQPMEFPGVKTRLTIGGEAIPLVSPHLPSEVLGTKIPLPNAREIRRAATRLRPVLENPLVEIPSAFASHLLEQAWKPMALLRAAWFARVGGEEQGRLSAVGLASAFNHPIAYLAWAIGDEGRAGKALAKVGIETGRGHMLDEAAEFQASLSRGAGGWIEPKRMKRTGREVQLARGDEGFHSTWAGQVHHLSNDLMASRVARAGTDDTMEWLMAGTGRNEVLGPMEKVFTRQTNGVPVLYDAAGNPNAVAVRRYVDSVQERVRQVAGDDPDIMAAIASGKFADTPLVFEKSGKIANNEEMLGHLRRLSNDGAGPEVLFGDELEILKQGSKAKQYKDRFVEYGFHTLMSRPSNYLARSVAFRQLYFQRAPKLLPLMTREGQAEMIEFAIKNKLRPEAIDAMREIAARGTGELTYKHADTVAKATALDGTKDLLYDMANRSQFSEATKLVFPFAEAWKEIASRWAKMVPENPEIIRRSSRALMAARQPGSGIINAVFTGEEQIEGQGFFYRDPVTGDDVFAYPGFEFLSDTMVGVPVRMTGRVEGLNIFSNSILPGFGPVVQVPAGIFLPDHPDWDAVRDVFLPFNKTDTEGGFVEAFLPAWLQKLRTAGLLKGVGIGPSAQGQKAFNNTVFDVARHLVASGEYERPSTPEEMEDMLDAAADKAQYVFAIRGAAQFFAPSAPSPQFLEKDVDGKFMLASKLTEEYRKLLDDKATRANASSLFLEKFGSNFYLYLQGKSRQVGGGAPVSKEGADWVARNRDIARDYPGTYGLYAPPGGELDIDVFGGSFRRGEREPLDPETATRLANARAGRMVYDQAKERVGKKVSRPEREWLAQVREALATEYPGYGDETIQPKRVDVKQVLREAKAAVDDPRLADNEAVKGLGLYLQGREKALAAAKKRGYSTLGGASVRDLATWLRTLADAIAEDHPDFEPLFERGLARELPREEPA